MKPQQCDRWHYAVFVFLMFNGWVEESAFCVLRSSGWRAALQFTTCCANMWRSLSTRRFTDVRAIIKVRERLTSSTVRGMHILYSFSNIFLGRVSPAWIHDVSKRPNERPSADGRGVCQILRRVKACGTFLWARVMKSSPSYAWVRSSEPADSPRWGM